MDTTDPDLHRLALTIGFTRDLIERHAPTQEWEALTHALLEEHTPEQLANMLTGAATIIARATRGEVRLPLPDRFFGGRGARKTRESSASPPALFPPGVR